MVFQVIGLGTDHTLDTKEQIRDYVQANWSLTGELAAARIKFGIGWRSDSADVEIHFKNSTPITLTMKTIGQNGFVQWDDRVYVHTFITSLSPNSEINEEIVGKVHREIVRIIDSNPKGLAATQGIIKMGFMQPPYVVPEEDPLQTTFHGIGIIGLMYMKADV
jgi:hypothetical protein